MRSATVVRGIEELRPFDGGLMTQTNPRWWTDTHTSKWERAKEALRRDWEQTKHDFGSKKARDLDQDVDDTVKQAAGKEPIPAPSQKSGANDRWDVAEPSVRYGWGAREQYRDEGDWNDRVEAKLKQEWNDLRTGRTWDEVKRAVRRGWDSAKS
jgi:hypothetical protein